MSITGLLSPAGSLSSSTEDWVVEGYPCYVVPVRRTYRAEDGKGRERRATLYHAIVPRQVGDLSVDLAMVPDVEASEKFCRWTYGAPIFEDATVDVDPVGDKGFRISNTPVPGEVEAVEGHVSEALEGMLGGMIREASNIRRSIPEAVTVSLKSRIAAEAGLKPTETFHVTPIGPIFSRHTRGGRTRSTLIIVRRLALQAEVPLTVHDPSISEARWQSVPPKGIELAPANRLALAHLLWPTMTEKERGAGYREIEDASERCSQWARSAGVIAAPAPWADRKRLESWMRGFP